MNLRMIYAGVIVLILAVVVYGVSFFVAKIFLPAIPKPAILPTEQFVEPPPLEPPLMPPFDEKEIKPASEIWQRWENLKKETDMPIPS